ncbi:MAG TPA: hypothetical protein VGK88_04675 [bacterium]
MGSARAWAPVPERASAPESAAVVPERESAPESAAVVEPAPGRAPGAATAQGPGWIQVPG